MGNETKVNCASINKNERGPKKQDNALVAKNDPTSLRAKGRRPAISKTRSQIHNC